MNDSILGDIKKLVGPFAGYDVFDPDLIMHINSEFFTLWQLGAGPKKPFSITGMDETWADFSDNPGFISACRQYIYLRVRAVFDPPSTSFVISSNENKMKELEWRIRDMCNGWIPDNIEPELPDDPETPDDPCTPCDHEIASVSEIDTVLDMVFGNDSEGLSDPENALSDVNNERIGK